MRKISLSVLVILLSTLCIGCSKSDNDMSELEDTYAEFSARVQFYSDRALSSEVFDSKEKGDASYEELYDGNGHFCTQENRNTKGEYGSTTFRSDTNQSDYYIFIWDFSKDLYQILMVSESDHNSWCEGM